jgi:calcineurin-like phosphoesterase family protein
MIYFTADTHFHHSNIIKLSKRPFKDVDEMNETLISNWNSLVTGNDEIYILGDFLYKGNGQQANEILKRLNGVKYLIKGNHERYLNAPEFDVSNFAWVKDFDIINYKDAQFVLFHYPILEWPYYFRKSAHLYGHVHDNDICATPKTADMLGSRAVNVGVDVHKFYPVSADVIYAQVFM